VTADRTVYDVRYSCRPLAGIAMVSMSIYLLSIKLKSDLMPEVSCRCLSAL